ncbi:MAG: zinc-dependent metalloprotease, partial [Candidatus Zixiibacteriota bacterium]
MRFKDLRTAFLLLVLFFAFTGNTNAGRRVRTFGSKQASHNNKKKDKPGKEKPFKKLIKDRVAIEGLFTFYNDTLDNSMLMSILPEQFGPIYLCNETRSRSEGAIFDNGSMGKTFPFYFKRVGKTVMFMEKNLRIRADTSSTMFKAVQSGISDHLIASTPIKSKPQDSTNAILIDPTDLFVVDAQNLSYFLGQSAKLGIRFNKKNSYFEQIKSFPENTEIDVKLHYKTSKPLSATTMQNPYSFYHTYHYSLSTLPKTDYVPRIADDRVGHFLTLYQDYTNLDQETPYVRYVERWHLKKKNPGARISEPVEPIVFWIENTVPLEYRDAIAEGIEFWNQSYKKIGFRNAIIAKQMPDTAEWDPADVRYNTIRWIVIPGGGYAVGPSRANPFTGQIYDADVRISSDFVRYMFNNMENFIQPLSFDGTQLEEENPLPKEFHQEPYFCNHTIESAKEAAFGLAYIHSVVNTMEEKDSLTKEYVHSYIVELVAHEVGHTLGFRHNFKASSIYSLDQIQNREFTRENSLSGTVMDYNPPNIARHGKPQGEFYASVPGPYDDWVIEYAYSDFGDISPEEELARLNDIASRAPLSGLAYGTDEDAFGSSAKSIDPTCNLFDQGNDPLTYCQHKIDLTNELWHNSIKKFEQDGNRYQKIQRVFQTAWRSYYESTRYASKYIGGLYHHRDHIGDPEGRIPFEPVPASEQRRA